MTPKKQLFVQEYLIDLNATRAAKRAGYSEKTAYSAGQRLLKDVDVATAIQADVQKRSEKTGIDAEWVLKEAAGLFEIAKAQLEESPSASMMSAAFKGLELVGKHIDVGAFEERVRHSGGVTVVSGKHDDEL